MIDFFTSIGTAIITPLYYATSAILMAWHWVFDLVLPYDSGWTWALAIIGLTATIRAMLIPLFVRQIKASRNMQLLQPKVKELQKKYGHDRQRLSQETMKLYQESGTNPFASCMPLILQAPVFFALFRLLDNAAHERAKGLLTQEQANSLSQATIFGARIADRFIDYWQGDASWHVGLVTIILVLSMTATTFTTQRQLMRKNMPETALSGPYAQQQKMLLYVLPVVFAVGGIAFPIGVLLYWTTSNLWTMGQQFYVIRNNPAPGTPAFKAKQDRDRRHGRDVAEDPLEAALNPKAPTKSKSGKNKSGKGKSSSGSGSGSGSNSAPQSKPRQQPKRQSRSQRKGGGKKPPRG
ncbi:MAG TPA: membrane protein insertase YidC [Nocardioidaceae bacterium]|nr:membrane protein insertase YidC [Nocardioidaceae bacterium]